MKIFETDPKLEWTMIIPQSIENMLTSYHKLYDKASNFTKK